MTRTILALLAALCFIGSARAQSYSVTSITDANFGDIVSAASGLTVFQSEASAGSVTRVSGSGVQIAPATANAVVSIRCSGSFLCNTQQVYVTLALAGSPTGRLNYITAINITNGSATIASAFSAGSYIVIYLNPIPRDATRTFLIGFTLPVDGNESASPTGNAVSQYLITASRPSGAGSSALAGNIRARVIRPVSIAKTQDLQFGRVTRPSSGSGSLTVSPAGAASVTGAGVRRLQTPASAPARFTVSGEGGQAVTVSVPSTVMLSGSAGAITATLSTTGSGAQVLSGSTGAAGSVQVNVGGTVPLSGSTPIGTLNGTVTVTVQYN